MPLKVLRRLPLIPPKTSSWHLIKRSKSRRCVRRAPQQHHFVQKSALTRHRHRAKNRPRTTPFAAHSCSQFDESRRAARKTCRRFEWNAPDCQREICLLRWRQRSKSRKTCDDAASCPANSLRNSNSKSARARHRRPSRATKTEHSVVEQPARPQFAFLFPKRAENERQLV